ncbi:orotidine-5'-phosphate decarboxylase [candidate division GN15 bacterium]|nr:orotidine-5'-phosphate decarboxylase [candidate division GN15 bacterium]
MSAVRKLQKCQQDHKSMICLGLDIDPKKAPSTHTGSVKGLFDFANKIIEATADQVCAYKPNLAFYESLGAEGISLLKLITERIPENIPIILDGKRGDIGNTASHYATFLYERLRGDWVTLNPYMGYDSMRPFLEHKEKGVFVLCLTSNSGSKDFQMLEVDGVPLYRIVADKVAYWNKDQSCGLVVGATHPDQLEELRGAAGDMPLLIPGVGAQGGALETAAKAGTDNFRKLAVINVSRSVLYASNDADFAQRARQELEKLNRIVNDLRDGEKAEESKPAGNPAPEQPSTEPSVDQPNNPGEQPPGDSPSGPEQSQPG